MDTNNKGKGPMRSKSTRKKKPTTKIENCADGASDTIAASESKLHFRHVM